MRSPSSSVRRARPLLGTIVEIQVAGIGEGECHTAIDTAFDAVEEVQRRMSFHDPASALSRLNRLAALEPVRVDEWTFQVLGLAAEMHRVSGGIFDLTIASALLDRGFLPSHESAPADSRRVAGFDRVQLSADRSVRFHDPAVCLDLGGIAKGFAVDQAVAALVSAGVPHGLVNAGGDLRAFGGEPFEVSIRHPDEPGRSLTVVPLGDGALATSAHYFADRLVEGAALAPIIDPRAETPADQVRSATVCAKTAMAADALTKVVVLMSEAALPVLEHFSAHAMFVADSGEIVCSPGWHAAFQLSP